MHLFTFYALLHTFSAAASDHRNGRLMRFQSMEADVTSIEGEADMKVEEQPFFMPSSAPPADVASVPYPDDGQSRSTRKQQQRHIQYLYVDAAGIGDRANIFSWLAMLGEFHNATVHIPGGAHGASLWLWSGHSPSRSTDWSRYFDIDAFRGNPFHELENLAGCKQINATDTNFRTIFDDGSWCVNIASNMRSFTNYSSLLRLNNIHLKPSEYVHSKAKQLAEDLPDGYGALHIRRCDRLRTNAKCTDVEQVCKKIAMYPSVRAWLVFYYAEPNYRGMLQGGLSMLSNQTQPKLIFEDDLDFGTDDNYFIDGVRRLMKDNASVFIDYHICQNDEPDVRLNRTETFLWEFDENFRTYRSVGHCGFGLGF